MKTEIKSKKDIHTVSLLVANEPGVLVCTALVFARRGYNIDSLVVSASMNPKYSRMTITAQGDPQTLDQIIKQSAKLIDVIHVSEHTGVDSVTKEVALIKVRNTPKNKSSIAKFCKKFHAHIINHENGALIVEQTGSTEELDAFEDLVKSSCGIIEMVRSGKLVMAIGKEPT